MNKLWITIVSLAVLAALNISSPFALAQSVSPAGVTDTTPPVTTATLSGSYAKGIYTSDVIVTLSASDGDSGVSHTEYSINNGSWIRYTDPVTLKSSGTIGYRSVDKAGNIEANNNASFTRIHISLGPGVFPAADTNGQSQVTPSAMPETLVSFGGDTESATEAGRSLQFGSPIVWLIILIFAVAMIGTEIYFLTGKK